MHRQPRRDVEDAYAVRAKLEGWAASMAVYNVTALFLARIEEKIGEEDEIFFTSDAAEGQKVGCDTARRFSDRKWQRL